MEQEPYYEIDPKWLDAHAKPCQCKICAEARQELITVLLVILDNVDYTRGNCRANEMVGAVLDKRLIEKAHDALKNAQGRKF